MIVSSGLQDHPWVVPAFLVWCVGLAVGWATARRLAVRRGVAGPGLTAALFWCAVGGMVAVTLTPATGPVDFGYWGRHVTIWGHPCLPQWPRTGFGLWAPNPQRRANVLIGVPLGLFAGLITGARGWGGRRERRGRTAAAVVLALLLPVLVEVAQAVLPLNRVCAVVDVVDNLSGVLIGLAGALAVRRAMSRLTRHGSERSRPRRA